MIEPWVQIIVQLGSFGLLAVFVYTTVTKTLPEKEKLYAESMKQRDDTRKLELETLLSTLRAHTDAFRAELAAERNENKSNVDKLLAAIEAQNRLLIFILGRGKLISDEERAVLGI
jgi:hypothetical protein